MYREERRTLNRTLDLTQALEARRRASVQRLRTDRAFALAERTTAPPPPAPQLTLPKLSERHATAIDPRIREAIAYLYTHVPAMRTTIETAVRREPPARMSFQKIDAWGQANREELDIADEFRGTHPRILAPLVAHELVHVASPRTGMSTREDALSYFREEMECERMQANAWLALRGPADSGDLVRHYEEVITAIADGKLQEHVLLNPAWQKAGFGEEV